MIKRVAPMLAALLLITGCAGTPDIAPKAPWYETISDLEKKAAILKADTMSRHVDEYGILMYKTFPKHDSSGIDLIESHNNADTPAWQGCLMAALAFEEAVTGNDTDEDLLRLASGFYTWYEATGIDGLLGRS